MSFVPQDLTIDRLGLLFVVMLVLGVTAHELEKSNKSMNTQMNLISSHMRAMQCLSIAGDFAYEK